MKTCLKCSSQFPSSCKIDGKRRCLDKRKYCLVCSPFLSRNTKQIHLPSDFEIGKVCPRCGDPKSAAEFYLRRNGQDLSSYCRTCTIEETQERQKRLKTEAIEYLGGFCWACGYAGCSGAMDFHHLDRSKKEFSISAVKAKAIDAIKPELDKCALLCARCHREVENGCRRCPTRRWDNASIVKRIITRPSEGFISGSNPDRSIEEKIV